MKKILCLGISLLALCAWSAQISRNTVIVKDGIGNSPENNAARILSETLGKMFGAEVKIVDRSEYDGKSPAVILKRGELAPEEWCIASEGADVVSVTGGKPMGVLYGVYELLEKFGGCRYYSPAFLYIPKCDSFFVPDGRKFQRKPTFARRNINSGVRDDKSAEYHSWNKINHGFCALKEDLIPLPEEYQYKPFRHLGLPSHSFYYWSKDFPADRPDFFSLDASGRRLRAKSQEGPGQLCLSNPDMRKVLKETIVKQIREDRENAAKYDYQPASIISLTHNDNGSYCVCKDCLKLMAKYGGGYSGILLDFVNDIAACAPDMKFETFAYTLSEDPPKGIKPADNVIMYLAFLGPELMNGRCDTMRPFSHPNNNAVRDLYSRWREISKTLTTWLYPRQYKHVFPAPNGMVWNYPENFRYLKKIGVVGILNDSNYSDSGDIGPRSFHDLHQYVAAKLMDDLEQDYRTLVQDFMTHFYGDGAPEMLAYLEYLQKRMDEEKGMLGKVAEHNRAYMDEDFLATIIGYCTAAMKKTAGQPIANRHVAMELMIVDFAAANMWERLPGLERRLGITRSALLDRLEKNADIALETVYGRPDERPHNRTALAHYKKCLQNKLQLLRHPLPVPPELKDQTVIQHPAIMFCENPVADPEAAGGRAMVYGSDGKHDKPLEAHLYLRSTKKIFRKWVIPREDVKQDEKYHLYYLGASVIPGNEDSPTYAFHYSWFFRLQKSLHAVYSHVDASREYDFYLSLKFTGPAYVAGSTSPNAIYLDRVLYVPRQAGDAMPKELTGRVGLVYPAVKYHCSKKFPLVADRVAASGSAYAMPRDGKTLEFGFYDRNVRRKVFQVDLKENDLADDGKYHLYSLGIRTLPDKKEKYSFWGHENWGLYLNNILVDAVSRSKDKAACEIFVSLKLRAKDILFDRVIFVEPPRSGADGKMKYALASFPNTSKLFKKVPDSATPTGQCYVIPIAAKPMQFGFYDNRTRKKLFQRNIADAELIKDGKYHLYSLGVHPFPEDITRMRFWGHDNWGLNLNDVLAAAKAGSNGQSEWEILVSMRADDRNMYVDQIVFAPLSQRNADGEMDFSLTSYINSAKFKVEPDAASEAGSCFVVPIAPKAMQFGFYDSKARKRIFQRNIPNAELIKDGKYHRYSLGVQTLPKPDDRIVFWGHDNWGLLFAPILIRADRGCNGRREWEIFVSMRADEQNMYIDRVIFAPPKTK